MCNESLNLYFNTRSQKVVRTVVLKISEKVEIDQNIDFENELSLNLSKT